MNEFIEAWVASIGLLIFTFSTLVSGYAFYKGEQPNPKETPFTGLFIWWYGGLSILCSITWVGTMFVRAIYKAAVG